MAAPLALLLSGTLFLSPTHSARLPSASAQVWFSDPQLVEAQVLGSQVVVRAKAAEGRLVAYGLQSTASDGLRIQLVSDADYEALERCPNTGLELASYPFLATRADPARLREWRRCGFEGLRMSPELLVRHEEDLARGERSLMEAGWRLGNAGWENGRRKLSVVGEAASAPALRSRLGEWAPFYALRFLTPPKPGRTLIFLVTLFEFSRQRAESLGLSWPERVQLLSLDGGSFSKLNAKTPGLGLDFGEKLGLGRVLAQPRIRCKPGETALFQSGGEIPVLQHTEHSSSTTWKRYGLILELQPEAQIETGATELGLSFKLELSEPDYAAAVGGTPGMVTRRLESRFDLRSGETTVLSTMIQSRRGAKRSGLPGLSEVPWIQRLFSRRDDNSQEMELWFAIQPSWEELPSRLPEMREDDFDAL